jgi:signal transduction histidine kinase
MIPDVDDERGERVATDRSLADERAQADSEIAKSDAASDGIADDIVRVARARADVIVDDARRATDRATETTSGTSDVAPRTERERTNADALLERERAAADATLHRERRANRRSLQHFLHAERTQTDQKLDGERIVSDDVIAARDNFLAMVSHDLRALLGALSIASELVAKAVPLDDVNREAREHAVTSERMVARMTRMVDDLVDITSIEHGRLGVVTESGDANAPVREVVAAFAPLATAKGITIDADVATQTLAALFDHERVVQVLANLVSNALRFTSSPGTITVRVAATERGIRFAVADTGVGIAADELEAVFERFRQLSPDRRGLGLGLYISKSIVEAHGGRIWVQSAPGAGSTFYFTLPTAAASPSVGR